MSRLSISSQTEKAFAAYIEAEKDSTVLSPCTIYVGQSGVSSSQITPPDIIMCADSPQQIGYDSNIYELKLKVTLETQVDDEPSDEDEDAHHERVEALRNLLENFSTIFVAMNHPASPSTDDREVKDFTLSAIVFEDEMQGQKDRRLVTDILYYICASPVNEPPVVL